MQSTMYVCLVTSVFAIEPAGYWCRAAADDMERAQRRQEEAEGAFALHSCSTATGQQTATGMHMKTSMFSHRENNSSHPGMSVPGHIA